MRTLIKASSTHSDEMAHSAAFHLNLHCLLIFRLEVFSLQSLNSFLAIGDFCCLPISFPNSLDPDQDRQNLGPDLDPIPLTLRQ